MTANTEDDYVHSDPVWRDRADFIITADVAEEGEPPQWEQLWARQVGENRYQLCCIPFFAYDLALGDIVDTETRGERQYVVRAVVERSGHSTFRIWFGNSPGHERGHQEGGSHHRVLEDLTDMGAVIEWSSHDLPAVDTMPEITQEVATYLWNLEQRRVIEYETGTTLEPAEFGSPPP
jgi:hypothetical protein